jgi:hypothetical protein
MPAADGQAGQDEHGTAIGAKNHPWRVSGSGRQARTVPRLCHSRRVMREAARTVNLDRQFDHGPGSV